MKINKSKSVEIKRSEINFASYNPRKKSDEVVSSLIRNFKKVGYLGGIVYNSKTKNLVSGHKRVEALDKIHRYSKDKDYSLRVEVVEFDEKTEKEQNIYMNNIEQQGEFDFDKLSVIVPDIDTDLAGLTNFQLEKLSVLSSDIEDNTEKKPTINANNKEKVKEAKLKAKEIAYDHHQDATNAHLTIVFSNANDKIEFCEMAGINDNDKMIMFDKFMSIMENII